MLNTPVTLDTPRLILRPWRTEDLAPFSALNADAEAMRHFPSTLTRLESDELVGRIMAQFAAQGWAQHAIERKADGAFIGLCGLSMPPWESHFTPCVEIGWRIARAHWGQGYVTEAAEAEFDFGFDVLKEAQIYSFTVAANTRSWRVMERLGMTRVAGGDFDHPRVAEGSPLRRHVLYRITSADWRLKRKTPPGGQPNGEEPQG